MRLSRAAQAAAVALALGASACCTTAPQREAAVRQDAEHTVAELYGHLAGCRVEQWAYAPLPLLQGMRARWVARCGAQTFVCWRDQSRRLIKSRDVTLCAPEAAAREAERGGRP